MRKLLLTLAVLCGTVSAWAQTYYKPGDRTTTLVEGKKYFISVATWYNGHGGACTNLLYNNDGVLAKSNLLPNSMVTDQSYLFTVEEVGDGYLAYIKNSSDKYIQADNLASTESKTGVYVIPYFTAKAVCCGDDVDACDVDGKKIAYANITAETPIVSVQKNADYTNKDNRNGWRYIGGLSAGFNWCTAFAFYEAEEAAPSSMPEITKDLSNPIYYTISNTRSASGKLIYWTEEGVKDSNTPGSSYDAYKFYFTGDSYSNLKIHNAATNLLFSGAGAWTEEGVAVEIVETPHSSKAGYAIKFSGTALNEKNNNNAYTTWYADDAGSIFVFKKAEEFLPSTGKTYFIEAPIFHHKQFKMKGLYVNADGNPAWGTIDEENNNYKWQIEVAEGQTGTAYKNVGTGKYLNGTSMSETAVYGNHNYLGQSQWNIVVNSVTVHANNHSEGTADGSNIVSWSTGVNGASAWSFLDVNSDYESYVLSRYNDYHFTFEYTIDDSNPIYYAIRSGRGQDKWYTYVGGQISLEALNCSDSQMWYFKKDASGYIRMYSKISEGKAISYESTYNGAQKIYAKSESDGWNSNWIFVRTNGAAPYGLNTYDRNNYLSHNGGGTNKMGLWNDAPSSDTGTAMYIHDIDDVVVPGKFYRIKNNSGTGYLVSGTGEGRSQFADATVIGKNSIFYYNDAKLLSYENGKYLANNSNFLHYTNAVGTSTSVYILPSTQSGKQVVIFNGNRYFYSNAVGNSNAGSGEDDGNYRFTVEPVTTLPVTITSAGYATFYCPVAVEIPEGVEAYYAAEANEDVVSLTPIEGVIIPANTGVILKSEAVILNGEANTYNFNIVADYVGAVDDDNKLAGTVASAYVEEDAYVLSKQGEVVGMYKAAKNQVDNTKWLNNGFKAYLPASVFTAGARFLVFDFGTETGIIETENGNVKTENVDIFDLSGRRVQSAQKGIFIVNGKKVIR